MSSPVSPRLKGLLLSRPTLLLNRSCSSGHLARPTSLLDPSALTWSPHISPSGHSLSMSTQPSTRTLYPSFSVSFLSLVCDKSTVDETKFLIEFNSFCGILIHFTASCVSLARSAAAPFRIVPLTSVEMGNDSALPLSLPSEKNFYTIDRPRCEARRFWMSGPLICLTDHRKKPRRRDLARRMSNGPFGQYVVRVSHC